MTAVRVPIPGELWQHRWLPRSKQARIVAVVDDPLFGGRQVVVYGYVDASSTFAHPLDEFAAAYAPPVIATAQVVSSHLRAVPS